MAKITLSDVSNISNPHSAQNTINTNSALIETALEKSLSRDGTSPNQMSADLDMNSNSVLNLPVPVVDSEPVRLVDLHNALATLSAPGGAVSQLAHLPDVTL